MKVFMQTMAGFSNFYPEYFRWERGLLSQRRYHKISNTQWQLHSFYRRLKKTIVHVNCRSSRCNYHLDIEPFQKLDIKAKQQLTRLERYQSLSFLVDSTRSADSTWNITIMSFKTYHNLLTWTKCSIFLMSFKWKNGIQSTRDTILRISFHLLMITSKSFLQWTSSLNYFVSS